MHKKALTVAIAGALVAPMAAQAVDFSISGRVSRALVITDTGDSTTAQVKNWGSSGSRVRVSGSNEMMDGMTVGGNLEYGAGGVGNSSLSALRRQSITPARLARSPSAMATMQARAPSTPTRAASPESATVRRRARSCTGGYFGSLDGGGGRNDRIRYDTPAIGPVSAAISVGNGDEVSAGVKVSQSFGDTAFGAKLGTTQEPGENGTISASAGIKLPAGVTVSGAWGTQGEIDVCFRSELLPGPRSAT